MVERVALLVLRCDQNKDGSERELCGAKARMVSEMKNARGETHFRCAEGHDWWERDYQGEYLKMSPSLRRGHYPRGDNGTYITCPQCGILFFKRAKEGGQFHVCHDCGTITAILYSDTACILGSETANGSKYCSTHSQWECSGPGPRPGELPVVESITM